ncbi:MAG: hypothetical protein LKI04_29130 [Paenibacillus lautus]|uniref:hypothetical protein n=1 Tax=Paenibacillus lautus TaxID=1401 RepID=UPI0026ECE3FB|nr:hypothetical protein [Paenibacillus lautus]MCI1778085.1 hypothetical protein [Paenibacillus lautus]
MFYLVMALWLVASVVAIIMLVTWIVSKANKRESKKKGIATLYLFISSIALLVIGITINAKEITPVSKASSSAGDDSALEVVMDANKFSRISPETLIQIMGEPESKEETDFKLSETRSYKSTYYFYGNNKYEFMIIDNEVVRFTYNGEYREKSDNERELFSIFKINPGPNVKKVEDIPNATRYQMVNDKIADFWVSFGSNSTIYKVTYNMDYFS